MVLSDWILRDHSSCSTQKIPLNYKSECVCPRKAWRKGEWIQNRVPGNTSTWWGWAEKSPERTSQGVLEPGQNCIVEARGGSRGRRKVQDTNTRTEEEPMCYTCWGQWLLLLQEFLWHDGERCWIPAGPSSAWAVGEHKHYSSKELG